MDPGSLAVAFLLVVLVKYNWSEIVKSVKGFLGKKTKPWSIDRMLQNGVGLVWWTGKGLTRGLGNAAKGLFGDLGGVRGEIAQTREQVREGNAPRWLRWLQPTEKRASTDPGWRERLGLPDDEDLTVEADENGYHAPGWIDTEGEQRNGVVDEIIESDEGAPEPEPDLGPIIGPVVEKWQTAGGTEHTGVGTPGVEALTHGRLLEILRWLQSAGRQGTLLSAEMESALSANKVDSETIAAMMRLGEASAHLWDAADHALHVAETNHGGINQAVADENKQMADLDFYEETSA